MPERVVEVAPERYPAWRARFEERNAGAEAPQQVVAVDPFDHDPLGIVLVRRGGYAVGLARGGELTAHKVGTAHVQSRTAKGGWSQQRYARRRGHQTDAVVERARAQVLRLLVGGQTAAAGPAAGVPAPVALALGGDRQLVAELLADPRLAAVADLPRRELYDLPDPRLEVLRTALERARAVRVTILDP